MFLSVVGTGKLAVLPTGSVWFNNAGFWLDWASGDAVFCGLACGSLGCSCPPLPIIIPADAFYGKPLVEGRHFSAA